MAGNANFSGGNTGNQGFFSGDGMTPNTTGNSVLNTVLDAAIYDGGKLNTLTLTGLTPGVTYDVQLFGVDTRSCCGTRELSFISQGGQGDGQMSSLITEGSADYILGKFVATGTTQVLYEYLQSGSGNMNALVLYSSPEPSACILLGLGAVGLVAAVQAAVAEHRPARLTVLRQSSWAKRPGPNALTRISAGSLPTLGAERRCRSLPTRGPFSYNGAMIFSWLKRRRRSRLLESPFPSDWLKYLGANVPHYALLTPEEQEKLRRDLRVFVAEKNWEGCAGLTVDDEMKVTIAAQACLLTLARDDDEFERVLSILVYPTEYFVPEQRQRQDFSIVGEGARLGEAWYRGPVILSWADVLEDSRDLGGGQNLVWHEFAHQLDMLDREVDGTPPLDDRAQYRQWASVMSAEHERLRISHRAGRPTLLDPYGTVSEGEFFAVVTECFFDQPIEMRAQHAELYDLLKDFYRQDTAARLERRGR